MAQALSIAIRAESLAKMYRLFDSKRDRLREALHPLRRTYHREFWALRNVSFVIPGGRTVGILGMNGSGKSTLLQIISGVLQPTAGSVHVEGKVAALLELGAGFNPELTGRENVVLNGTILGLSRAEVRDRMGDIAAFADVGEFFDQSMKTYSSGMFMRVAFATALYVDPDVLVIDEALSVGDARFQEKCFRRFRGFQQRGKTILFVTHDRSALPRYCDAGLLLHQGELVAQGEPAEIAELYGELLTTGRTVPQRSAAPSDPTAAAGRPVQTVDEALGLLMSAPSTIDRCPMNPTYNAYEHRFGTGAVEIVDYLIVARGRVNSPSMYAGTEVDLYMRALFRRDIDAPIAGIIFKNKEGVIVYGINTQWLGQRLPGAKAGAVEVYRFTVRLNLAAGDWFVDLAIAESSADICDNREALIHLHVMDAAQYVGLAKLETQFARIDAADLGGQARGDKTPL